MHHFFVKQGFDRFWVVFDRFVVSPFKGKYQVSLLLGFMQGGKGEGDALGKPSRHALPQRVVVKQGLEQCRVVKFRAKCKECVGLVGKCHREVKVVLGQDVQDLVGCCHGPRELELGQAHGWRWLCNDVRHNLERIM